MDTLLSGTDQTGGGVNLHSIKTVCLLLCRQEPTWYDEMLKKESHNLRVCDGRCYELPYNLQSSDRGNAGCVWIDSAREFVDATAPRHQVLLQVRITVNRHEFRPIAAYLFFMVVPSLLTFICP